MISNVAEDEISLVELDLISRSFYDPGHGTSVKLSCYPGHVLDEIGRASCRERV